MTVIEALDSAGIQYDHKETDNVYIECPRCGKDKLSINIHSGLYHCWSGDCEDEGNSGSFSSLAELLSIELTEPLTTQPPPKRDRTLNEEDAQALRLSNQNKTEVIEWATSRSLDPSFVLKQGVGYDKKTQAVVLPLRDPKTGSLIGAKYRAKNGDQWLKGKEPALYVLDTSDLKKEKIVVVEGEVDALTLRQIGIPVVATLGASKDKGFGLLADVRQIYLGYDMDAAGEAGTEKAVTALGGYRCKRIEWEAKDPNDMMMAGATADQLLQCVKEAKILARDVSSLSAADTLEAYFEGLKQGQKPRRSWGFPRLDSFSKGLGGGELVGVLAESGTGKTTFILNVLANHVAQGIKVGFASLEEHPVHEITPKLVSVTLGKNIFLRGTTARDVKDAKAALSNVQLYTQEVNLAKVVDWVRECYFVHDCKMVAIDYFQLLVPDEESVQAIKETIFTLKNLTKELHDLCILLVIQPKQKQRSRKKDGTEAKPLKLEGADARGGAAINQTVDKMLTIAQVPGHANLTQYEYTKCRGHMYVSKRDWYGLITQLEYDHASLKMSEVQNIIYGSD